MRLSNLSRVGRNTGQIEGDVERGAPQALLIGSPSFGPNDTVNSDTFEAAIIAKINQSNTANDKLYPFVSIQGNTDKTEAAKFASLGYGLQIKLNRSKNAYELDFLPGNTLEQAMMAFDNKIVSVLVLDDNLENNLWGVQDAAGNFFGARMRINVEPRGMGDGNNAKTTKVTISYVDPRDFVENAKVMKTTFAAGDLDGLYDVKLVEPTAHASNVHYLKAYVPTAEIGNGKDITAQFGSLLGSGSLWTAKTGTNFQTPLTITSVTYDASNDRLVFTFDSTAYSALSTGAKIKVIPASVSALYAASVFSLEIQFVILTKS